MMLFGGIEAGGTKFVCVIADEQGKILQEKTLPTLSFDTTISAVCDFFCQDTRKFLPDLVSIGIGCFGPLDLNPQSATYGSITKTSKPGWSHTPVVNILKQKIQRPVAIDTDVNAAAMGEKMWGSGKEVDNLLYITIGTGIGGGAVVNGKPVHGLIHPEMGHIYIPHDKTRDPYPGICPFHGDCFEGLASGPALADRWGQPAEKLPVNHPAWDLEAEYIGCALADIICILSPQKIILGGGVMQQSHLIPKIRKEVISQLKGYIQSTLILKEIDQFIVLPGLGNRSGALGAISLAINSIK